MWIVRGHGGREYYVRVEGSEGTGLDSIVPSHSEVSRPLSLRSRRRCCTEGRSADRANRREVVEGKETAVRREMVVRGEILQ